MTTVQELSKTTTPKRLLNKVALVTGSSRGIGAAIALRLAAEGATVAVNYTNNKTAADQVAGKIKELGNKVSVFKANVSSEQESKKLIDDVVKEFGKIDILVNNAAVFEMQPLEQMDVAHFQRVFDINVKGVVATTIAAIKHISDGGRIINISSGVTETKMANASVYTATKAALEALTGCWAQELGKRHITVNAVAPGTTATEMLLNGLPEDQKNYMIGKTALGRLGEPQDIADVVAFIASPDARWITGQTVHTNGGLVI